MSVFEDTFLDWLMDMTTDLTYQEWFIERSKPEPVKLNDLTFPEWTGAIPPNPNRPIYK
jgi:hypothetical protein